MKRFLATAAAMAFLVMGNPGAHSQDTGINGKWTFVLETPGGERDVPVTIAVDADGKVTGKFVDTDITGTFKDGKLDLNFQFTSDEAGETAAMKITGKLDETAAIVGDWEFSSYNGTFKGTRPSAAPPADAPPATPPPPPPPPPPANPPTGSR